MIDMKINFTGRLDYACEEAGNTSVSLARMIPSIGRSGYSRRVLVAGVICSILLYAALICEIALECENRRVMLLKCAMGRRK